MKQAKSATAAAAAPPDRSQPPAAAGSSRRCQARCDHGEEATAPAVHGNEQSRWVRGLQCSDPLCAYTAARQLARILQDQTAAGGDEPLVRALDPVLAQLLMPPHQQQLQQSHWGHSAALCPRGMGALQLLSHLSRLYVRSSSAIEPEHHSHVGEGDVTSEVAAFMQAALSHLSAVSAACIESNDVSVQGDLLSFLVDLGQIVLDHDVLAERRAWGRDMLRCLEQRLERLLLLPSELNETLNLLLIVRAQLGFQQQQDQPQEDSGGSSGANAHRTHRMVLERSIAQLRALDVAVAAEPAQEDDADEREEQQRTLWLLVAASLRACVSSLPHHPTARAQRLPDFSGVWVALHGAMRLEVGDAAADGDGGGDGGAAFRVRLIALLSEEDDKLVDTLLHLAHVHAAMDGTGSPDKQQGSAVQSAAASSSPAAAGPSTSAVAVLAALDPYALLHDFLALLSFDHVPLLDWLVSNETACLTYLHVILRRTAAGHEGFERFAEACGRAGAGAGAGAAARSASDRCDSDSEDHSPGPEHEQQQESGLDAVMSCLIRLHLALKRLLDKGLFPYPIGPLLRSLQRIEAEYERAAGDSDGEDDGDGDGDGDAEDDGHGDSDDDA